MGQARRGTNVFLSRSCDFVEHIVPACDCQPSANSTLLVVASTVENFVLIHFMGKDRNLGARWLQ